MTLRHLYGPVSASFAERHLHQHVASGHCLPFDASGEAGLRIDPSDTWEAIRERFPPGWEPDFIALDLHYTTIPPALWTAPVPVVELAIDWNLLWHLYRQRLRRCELVLTDPEGVAVLQREGIAQARAANLYGCERPLLDRIPTSEGRDIDVLFVGNLNPAVQRQRMPWLGRLARLAGRHRVVVATDVFGEDYRNLLHRSRIVFNRALRRECNMRAFEAAASGALLFQERDNPEVPLFFDPKTEYVAYGEDDLETLLDHFLAHEDERRKRAEAARARVAEYGFDGLWGRHLHLIEKELPAMRERVPGRYVPSPRDALLERTWQLLSANRAEDAPLVPALALAAGDDSELLDALGLAAARIGPAGENDLEHAAGRGMDHFRQAVAVDPWNVLAGLNLAEALALRGEKDASIAQAIRTLERLEWNDGDSATGLDGCRFPSAFGTFRVEWERAAWQNPGDPVKENKAKRTLLYWRLRALLAELTGDVGHATEAVLARPDLPSSRALLGRILLRAGRPADAATHLHIAVQANPFDASAARNLDESLRLAGRGVERQRLARDRRLLVRAAAGIVKPEPWFAEPLPVESKRIEPVSVAWHGPLAGLHSLAHVNRQVCARLIGRGHHLAFPPGETAGLPEALVGRVGAPLASAEVTVRHGWPPELSPPASGRWVMMQPWEFGSLPREWVEAMRSGVDEVWANSRFVLESTVGSGVPAEIVHWVPLGVDVERFHPQVPPRTLRTGKRFRFLFVGGTIHRKGIDILLEAYARAFSAHDDVCLVIKDVGGRTFYQGQTAQDAIARFQARPNAPEIEYLDEDLAEADLAGIYTACHCLAHPYRGEGFGLPIAEAMACGLPVLVTGYGAALDFCDEQNAYLLPARLVRFEKAEVGGLPTVGHPWLAEVDPDVLAHAMRRVVDSPEEAKAKGRAGCETIRSRFTWDHTVLAIERRLDALRKKPIRRQHGDSASVAVPAAVPAATAAPRTQNPAKPSGNELASVVLLCEAGESELLACLDSVLAHTRKPYELILVGGRAEWAARLIPSQPASAPERVETVPSSLDNVPAAINSGLGRARGRFLAVLPTGEVVPPGWLDYLLKGLLHRWPEIGFVGPVGPGGVGEQGVSPPRDAPSPQEFAARLFRERRGEAAFVNRLGLSCLVTSRDALDRIGSIDERFASGIFADVDLSLRAADAGLRLMVARDIYVHTRGGFTNGRGLGSAQDRREAFDKLLARWGSRAEVLRPESESPIRTGAPRRQRTSLCMIVRDESANLPRCLASAADLVDEVVVVDTGSKDETRELARRAGARVFEFAWRDDFAAARNESLKHATGEWVFWLDADEWLDDEARAKVRALFGSLRDEKAAYLMQQFSEAADGTGSAMAVDQVRLFRRESGVGWRYRVHEQVLFSLRQAGHEALKTDIRIRHSGFREGADSDRKLQRNLRLLRLQYADDPTDPITLYHLGLALGQSGQAEEALTHLRRCLEVAPADYSFRPKLHSMIGRNLQRLGRHDEALTACRRGLAEHPGDVELQFLLGLLLFERSDLAGAAAALARLLDSPRRERFVTRDAGLDGYKARHLLGEVYVRQGRHADAEAQWRKAVQEHPGFGTGWATLAERYLRQRRWAEMEEAVAALAKVAPVSAGMLQARAHLARGERDLAESALRVVLALSPGHAEATRLLAEVRGSASP